MIRFVSVLIFLSCIISADEIVWLENLDNSLQLAGKRDRKVLVYFHSRQSLDSQKFEMTTLADYEVKRILEDFVCVKLSLEKSPELVGKYEISKEPTFVMLDKNGGFINKSAGFQDPKLFLNWLKQSTRIHTLLENKKDENQEGLIVKEFKKADEEEKKKLVLLNCNDYLEVKQPVLQEQGKLNLKVYFQADPVFMIDYLNDERLGIRILFDSIVRESTNTVIDFDPWVESNKRNGQFDIIKEAVKLKPSEFQVNK